MALTDESAGVPATMLVSPNNGGLGGFGDGGWWIILLFLLLLGGNGFGGYNQPFVANETQRGFDQAAIISGINGVNAGVNNLSTQLCNGFSAAEIADNSRAMANMQQIYGLSSQFANCCCENRLASADLKYTIATENCADRAALSDGIREIITNQTANTQRILDQLCSDKIDAKNDKIADLERQLAMANLAASQVAQTAQLIAELKPAA